MIKAAKADVVGLQESHGEERDGVRPDAAAVIAQQLGWHYFDQGDDDTGIISRYKLVGSTPKKWGATSNFRRAKGSGSSTPTSPTPRTSPTNC